VPVKKMTSKMALSNIMYHDRDCNSNLCNFILGSFGRVLLSKNKKSGEYFAMKRLKKADIIKLRQVDHVISENTILADIDHPFLVSFIIVFTNSKSNIGWIERFLIGL